MSSAADWDKVIIAVKQAVVRTPAQKLAKHKLEWKESHQAFLVHYLEVPENSKIEHDTVKTDHVQTVY